MDVSVGSVKRYCGFHHTKNLDSENGEEKVLDWLQNRFERFLIVSREVGAKSGDHLQWYGETLTEWNKDDMNDHGKKAKLGKFLTQGGDGKRYSKQKCKKDRDTNITYVCKDGNVVYCSDISVDVDTYIGRWRDYRHPEDVPDDDSKEKSLIRGNKGSKTYQEKLMQTWQDNGSPTNHREICSMLYKSKIIPWNNCTASLIIRAANWLEMIANNDVGHERMMREIDDMMGR